MAKPLHVGHLRSTIIGDALTRILRFLGHTVITDNHLGDWGTQFGILLYGYKQLPRRGGVRGRPGRANWPGSTSTSATAIKEAGGRGRRGREAGNPIADGVPRGDGEAARGRPGERRAVEGVHAACLEELHADLRAARHPPFDHEHGESFYHPMLRASSRTCSRRARGREQGGGGDSEREGDHPADDEEQKKEEPPAIIRKRDGAFTYTTTDLATIKYRVEHLQAGRDALRRRHPQALHFKTLFAQARRWGYDRVEFEHIKFGSVLGKDGKPFGTRKGGAVEAGVAARRGGRARPGRSTRRATPSGRTTATRCPELTDEEKQRDRARRSASGR